MFCFLLICFAALLRRALGGDESLFLFNCVAVRAAVGYTFWTLASTTGACLTEVKETDSPTQHQWFLPYSKYSSRLGVLAAFFSVVRHAKSTTPDLKAEKSDVEMLERRRSFEII